MEESSLQYEQKEEKTNNFSKVKLPLCLSTHFPNLGPKTMLMFEGHKGCARSAPTTSPRNARTLSLGRETNRERARGTAQALERLSSTQTALSKLF